MSRLLFYSVPLAAAGISSWRWYLQPPQPPEPPPAVTEPVYIPSRFPPLEATDDTAISRPPSVLELHSRPLARMRAGDENQRREAAAMLSQAHGLTEPDCRQLGQTLDHRTALLLANWTPTDLRMFLPPRGVSAATDSAPSLEVRLRLLLESLPPGAPCAEFWRARALRHPPPSDWDPAPLAADAAELGAPAPWRSASSSAVEADCLRALRERADSAPQRSAMLAAGALDLLAAAHAQKPRDAARCGVIAQILGGFDSAQLLHQAGWLGVLAAWSREKDIRVGPGAWRVIRNLTIEERLLGTSKTTSGVGDSGRTDDHEMRKCETGGSKRAKTGNVTASDEAGASNLAEKSSKLSEDSWKTNVTTTTTTSGTTITHEPDDPVASAIVSLDLRLAALRSRISSFLSSLGLPSLPSTPPPSPRVLRPLPDGVLVLHPRSISAEEKTEVDIVFVHGLLGGTERTWRQADSAKGELPPPPEPRLSEIVMRIHGEEGRSVDKGDREESQKSGEDVAKAGGDVTKRSSDAIGRSSDVTGENHVSRRSSETVVADSNHIDGSANGKERVNRKNGVMDCNISKSDPNANVSTGRSVGKGQAVSEANTSSSNNSSGSSNIASTNATTAGIASNGSTARSTSSTTNSTAFSTSTMASTDSTSNSTSTALSFFTSSPDPEPYTQCWPRDWLPTSLHPLKVRILSVDYDSAWSDWRPRCAARRSRTLAERAAELRKLLEDAGVGDRPVVWVTHSMGGLLVKKMLVDVEKEVERADGERGEGMVERVRREEIVKGGKATVRNGDDKDVRNGDGDAKIGEKSAIHSSEITNGAGRGDLNHPLTTNTNLKNTNLPASPSPLSPLLSSTLGVVFLSCPHTGSALATSVSGPLYPLLLPSVELHSLCRHSPPLLQLREEFVSLCLRRGTPCLSVAETLPQPLLGRKVRFVEADSADAGVGKVIEVAENHLGVCKPKDRESEVYKVVVEFVKEVCAGL